MPRGKIDDINCGLTRDDVLAVLRPDSDVGIFYWVANTGKKYLIGTRAGSIGANGYVYISINNRAFRANRLMWLCVTGQWPVSDVDHENRVKTDNRFSNLRLATRGQNNINADEHVNNTSGRTGVSWSDAYQKWRSYITVDGKQISLGSHEVFDEAVDARITAEQQYFGAFARCA